MNETLTAQHDPFASSLAGRRLGRYEVLARLASGGMAGVYVARAIGVAGFERFFAVKVLHPHLAHEEEFISMFLDEARLAARIRHPNVVPTIDISDTPDAGFYLVMDYIEGDHLGALLQTAWKLEARLPWQVSMRIVVDALDGLAAAHNLVDETGRRLNLVHRDVSPHNIMVSTDGIARLTDFGVAKAEVRLSTTRDGQFKGKLAYMAPEHASNGEADQRSDLFSMAIILWECLTGRRLFRAENHAATLNKICLEPIPLPSEVDPALAPFDHVLAKGLARDPDQRYQSAEEFAEAIEQHASALSGMAKQREVAQLVREFAAEKIARDAELIRGAIAQLSADGASGVEPVMPARPYTGPIAAPTRPAAAEPAAPRPPLPPPPLGAPAAVTGPATDLELENLEAPASRKAWVVLALLFALVATIGIVLARNSSREQVRSVPLANETGANETGAKETGAKEIEAKPLEPSAAAPTAPAATTAASPESAEETNTPAASTAPTKTAGEPDTKAGSDDELGARQGTADQARAREDDEPKTAEATQKPSGRRDKKTQEASIKKSDSSASTSTTPTLVVKPAAEVAKPPTSTKPAEKTPAADDLILNPYRR